MRLKKQNFVIKGWASLLISLAVLLFSMPAGAEDSIPAEIKALVTSNRWASSVVDESGKRQIAIHDGDTITRLTQGHFDNKPSWSKTGDMLTFFRWHRSSALGITFSKGVQDNLFNIYRTNICVINVDGKGIRELTDDSHANLNPTWTRDGSNQIIFTRFHSLGLGQRIYMIDPGGEKNSAVVVTSKCRRWPLHFDWVESGLTDGRLFIWRMHWLRFVLNIIKPGDTMDGIQTFHLLDPKTQTYEDVKRPNKYPVHKLSVSPSETKVCYMKDLNGNPMSYNDSVIAYAEFFLNGREVKNEVVISPDDRSYTDMYPRWSPDEKYIMYSSSRSGKWMQYVYSLETKETYMVSDPGLHGDFFPCFEDMPK